MVKPCSINQSRTPEGETACGSYFYVGEMNVVERLGRGDPAGSNSR